MRRPFAAAAARSVSVEGGDAGGGVGAAGRVAPAARGGKDADCRTDDGDAETADDRHRRLLPQ